MLEQANDSATMYQRVGLTEKHISRCAEPTAQVAAPRETCHGRAKLVLRSRVTKLTDVNRVPFGEVVTLSQNCRGVVVVRVECLSVKTLNT